MSELKTRATDEPVSDFLARQPDEPRAIDAHSSFFAYDARCSAHG